jgi:hypothetical protein
MSRFALLAPSLLAIALVACHGQDTSTTTTANAADGTSDAALPKPAPAGGSVTGMPSKPGPGPVGPPESATDEETAIASDTEAGTESDATDAITIGDATTAVAPTDTGAATAEPTPDDAAAVVRAYYAALATHDLARAHAYWTQGARPATEPGTEPETTGLAVDVGAPGRMDAAAGSRYVRVPVTVTRTLRDGGTVRSNGMVTLRRSVVDGATPEQRAWRIASADLAAAPTPP